MSTHVLIFAGIGIVSTAAVITFAFFALLKHTEQLLAEFARRRDGGEQRDREHEQRRRAWARCFCAMKAVRLRNGALSVNGPESGLPSRSPLNAPAAVRSPAGRFHA